MARGPQSDQPVAQRRSMLRHRRHIDYLTHRRLGSLARRVTGRRSQDRSASRLRQSDDHLLAIASRVAPFKSGT